MFYEKQLHLRKNYIFESMYLRQLNKNNLQEYYTHKHKNDGKP